MLLDLAEHKDEGFVSLKDISERQDISRKYLEQIVTLLGRPGFLRANRGKKGGYMLAKEPRQYTVGEILRITEGGLAPVSCLEDEPNQCKRCNDCMTLSVWKGLQNVIDVYLDNITLQTILDKKVIADKY